MGAKTDPFSLRSYSNGYKFEAKPVHSYVRHVAKLYMYARVGRVCGGGVLGHLQVRFSPVYKLLCTYAVINQCCPNCCLACCSSTVVTSIHAYKYVICIYVHQVIKSCLPVWIHEEAKTIYH
jgi:hypothetical protein